MLQTSLANAFIYSAIDVKEEGKKSSGYTIEADDINYSFTRETEYTELLYSYNFLLSTRALCSLLNSEIFLRGRISAAPRGRDLDRVVLKFTAQQRGIF